MSLPSAGSVDLARAGFDVGLLTDHADAMLGFWRDTLGLSLEASINPTPGLVQHRLTMYGSVLKLNCLASPIRGPARMAGIRMLLLADDSIEVPQHVRDPDGNLVCRVPRGFGGVRTFGVHLAVSDEQAFRVFHRDVLGLEALGHNTYDFAGATLSFSWSPDVEPNSVPQASGFGYLTFQVMDVQQAHADLCARGAKELSAPGTSGIATTSSISFIADPDGNRIELSQRPDLIAAAVDSRARRARPTDA
jgi:catechol 2,3-dioxygenase-like lactoylglutathione lyase family enzyme